MSMQPQFTKRSASRPSRPRGIVFLSLALAAIFAGTVLAQGPEKPKILPASPPSSAKAAPPPALGAAHELAAQDLEAFLDGLMPAQIESDDIAGAVISVVKDGHVLFAKGYGFSDVEKRKP